MATMMAQGTKLFETHFSAPALATWSDLKNGCMRSFTAEDFKGAVWDSFLCSIVFAVGGITANILNDFAHRMIPKKNLASRPISILTTTVSIIAGATASFFIASYLRLTPFSSDKALKIGALVGISTFALTHVLNYFKLGDIHGYVFHGYLIDPLLLGSGATAGYFGNRSLYVIGALGALKGAVVAGLFASLKAELQDL